MKITVKISLQSDGDFSLNYDRFKKDISGLYEYEEICSQTEKNISNSEDLSLTISFINNDPSKCRARADTLLSSVLTNIHVIYTHYYVLEDLFNAFDGAIRAIYTGENYYNSISGNYDGTDVEVIFEEEYKNE